LVNHRIGLCAFKAFARKPSTDSADFQRFHLEAMNPGKMDRINKMKKTVPLSILKILSKTICVNRFNLEAMNRTSGTSEMHGKAAWEAAMKQGCFIVKPGRRTELTK
jgi:hypothetical protein